MYRLSEFLRVYFASFSQLRRLILMMGVYRHTIIMTKGGDFNQIIIRIKLLLPLPHVSEGCKVVMIVLARQTEAV